MLKQLARNLRKNATDAEKLLWYHLRSRRLLGFKFRRQAVMGSYIVDFVCHDTRLIIEIDGSQHMQNTQADQKRTAWLESRGFRVLRFWNHEVLKQKESVLERIVEALPPLTLTLSPKGGEGTADRQPDSSLLCQATQ